MDDRLYGPTVGAIFIGKVASFSSLLLVLVLVPFLLFLLFFLGLERGIGLCLCFCLRLTGKS